MTKKDHIIKAITEMNVALLEVILDNNRSYVDVPKEIFLKEFYKKTERLKNKGFTKFHNVVKGTCQKCYAGCAGYSFLTESMDYLDLLIQEEEEGFIDITQCINLKNQESIAKGKVIFLNFKKDIKSSYIPTSHHLSLQKSIEKAELEFKSFENKIISLETLENWHNKWRELSEVVKYMRLDYHFVASFLSTYFNTQNILTLKTESAIADEALMEWDTFKPSEERKLIGWLKKYSGNEVFNASSSYTKTDNWREIKYLLFKNSEDSLDEGLKSYENVVMDVSRYLNAIKFGEIYSKYYYRYYEEIEGEISD